MKSIGKSRILPVAILAAGFLFSIPSASKTASAVRLPTTDFVLSVKAKDKEYVFRYPEIDLLNGELYLKNAEEIVDGIYLDTLISPVDAAVERRGLDDFPFVFIKEKVGLGVDKPKLLEQIKEALRSRSSVVEANETLEINPSVSLDKLREETFLRGEFAADYSLSTEKRKNNVALAAKSLFCVEIPSGTEFSFNLAVGERTEERGYSTAKVIENGKFVEGVGGGVCQVSSVVYNAALLSGMRITERRRHTLAVSYVEPSFDAMVSYGYADLRFINPTERTIRLLVDADGERIRARIYGIENEYFYKRVSQISEYSDPLPTEIIYADDLLPNEERPLIFPKRGVKSVGILEKYSGDKLIERKLLCSDEYSSLRGVTLKGKP